MPLLLCVSTHPKYRKVLLPG